jgi:peptide deformylase
MVTRSTKVTLSGLDRQGTPIEMQATGWLARMLQHEIDHLSGHLYIDTMNTRSFISEKEYASHWIDKLSEDLNTFRNAKSATG